MAGDTNYPADGDGSGDGAVAEGSGSGDGGGAEGSGVVAVSTGGAGVAGAGEVGAVSTGGAEVAGAAAEAGLDCAPGSANGVTPTCSGSGGRKTARSKPLHLGRGVDRTHARPRGQPPSAAGAARTTAA